jgi:glutamine synthetase
MKNFGFKDEKEVLSLLKKRKEIKFIRMIFPDVLGREMSFCIPSEELESAFKKGKGFDGSSVEGFARIEESDLYFFPDPKTFRVLPWDYQLEGVAWKEAIIFGKIFDSKGNEFLGDSRGILEKVLLKTKSYGELFVGPELEFYIFKDERNTELLDHGGYFYGGKWGEIRKLSQIYLSQMGINVECDHHEVGKSQHEIDLKFDNALSVADSIMITKYVLKRVARKAGVYVSFMPKPITGMIGTGMHLHLSLWQKNKNLFFGNKKDYLSQVAKKYLMGLIKYGREIQLVLNQWVNSYKRLVPGFEAPVYLAWGTKNRSAYVRVPEVLKDKENNVRIELRSPDPACNIYLALAAIQSAGVQGIKENLKIVPPQERNIYKMTREEMKRAKIVTLAKDLKESLEIFKKSNLMREALGEHIFLKLIQNKEIEWQRYKEAVKGKYQRGEVSPYEIEEYLAVL